MKSFLFISLMNFSVILSAQGTWTAKASLGTSGRELPSAFSIGNKGYVGLGIVNANPVNDLWEYDPSANTWTQRANFPGPARRAAVGLSIGNKGYMGLGWASNYLTDFYEYDPQTNNWTQKANFGGPGRRFAAAVTVGSLGYVTCGDDGAPYESDIWEYNPQTNGWTQLANFGTGLSGPAAFALWGKVYVCTGNDNSANFTSTFLWEYNTSNNTWTQRANFTGPARRVATGFSNCGAGYVGTGWNGSSYYSDFYMYYPATNSWSSVATLPGTGRYGAIAMNINGTSYVGMGTGASGLLNDFYSFDHCAFASVEENANQYGLPVLSVFPNPSQGTFTLDLKSLKAQSMNVQVFDITGSKVYQEKVSGGVLLTLELSLPPGEYSITVGNDSGYLGVGRVLVLK